MVITLLQLVVVGAISLVVVGAISLVVTAVGLDRGNFQKIH